jgi:hypothetical protein
LYYNTSTGLRVYNGSAWVAAGGGGGVTSVTAGTGLSGGTITSTGTIAIDSTVATLTGSQTLTNKSISGSANTLTNIPNSALANQSITVNGSNISLGGSATVTAVNPNALTIGTGLSGTSYTGGSAVTIAIDSTVATLSGTQTLTNKSFGGATFNSTGKSAFATPAASISTSSGANNLEVLNAANSAGNDAFITFHNQGTYATNFGLSRATNRLMWGGWSAGANQYQIYSAADLLPNSALTNSSITVNGTAIALGGSASITTSLTTQVSGTLPVANGGTGVTTSTGSGNNVLSTAPTLNNTVLTGTLTAGGTVGSNGQVLVSTGAGIGWSSIAGSWAPYVVSQIPGTSLTPTAAQINQGTFFNMTSTIPCTVFLPGSAGINTTFLIFRQANSGNQITFAGTAGGTVQAGFVGGGTKSAGQRAIVYAYYLGGGLWQLNGNTAA